MRAIDTNVLLRIVTGDDPKQTVTADAFVENGAWVSHLVLAETCWVLGSIFRQPAEHVAGVINRILEHQQITLQEPDVVEAALATFRERPTLSFSDCLILAVARKHGHVPLGTFDRTLAKLEGVELL